MKITRYTDFVHTGPGTLAGRFLRRFWHPVYRAEDLASGQANPVRLLGEEFTLYRGETGTPHLVAFRCAHRGTQLSAGWVEGDAIRCFYHGWKYDAAGRCVEQPAEPQPFCEKVRIRSYPCVEYIGCVWAYLGEGEPPPRPRYPVFEEPGVLDVLTYIWPCNYFQAIENQHDQSHIPFVHRESSPFKGGGLTVAGVPTLRAEESEYGLTIHGNWSNGSVRKNHWFMPNTIQIKQPVGYSDSRWMDLIEIIVPVDDEHHARFHMSLIPVTGDEAEEFRERRQERHEGMDSVAAVAERVLAGELRVDDVSLPPAMMVNLQDAVAQLGQDTIADREHERLGRSDTVVIAMRQLWERELRALDEGRPLKQWTHPGRLVSTSGIRA